MNFVHYVYLHFKDKLKTMLSKALIKIINSLSHKKYREKYRLFVAEGEKLVGDLIKMRAPVKTILSSKPINYIPDGVEFIQCAPSELDKISFMMNNQGIIALIRIIDKPLDLNSLNGSVSIGLDGIQDPGNIGTIIRLANWFGVKHILCSKECADIYNPKVVQATMGAMMGVEIHYLELENVLKELKKSADFKLYGTYMEGESIYSSKLKSNGMLIMGNEGKGISERIGKLINKKISIPPFYSGNFKVESLNVGVATGIIISEFVRQSVVK
jgi:RNA methyltransferase, TrmH family